MSEAAVATVRRDSEHGRAVATLRRTMVERQLRPFDVNDVLGFTIAGADKKFVVANAKIVDGKKIEVWSEGVDAPVAVRYAWADNPVCNVMSQMGLPLTPFRTDDWPGVTINNK